METITSTDGTMIAYQRSGTGPPLVLVHGTTADHTRWTPVLPAFEQHFTVYGLDRRGRGGSGDAGQYAIEREFEDTVAVVNSIEEPIFLLGHSYGALCSLEAASRTAHLRKLILYEPPIPTGIEIYLFFAREKWLTFSLQETANNPSASAASQYTVSPPRKPSTLHIPARNENRPVWFVLQLESSSSYRYVQSR